MEKKRKKSSKSSKRPGRPKGSLDRKPRKKAATVGRSFEEWMASRQPDSLPKSYAKIAKMAKVREPVVASFYRKKGDEIRNAIKDVPDLRKTQFRLTDDRGTVWPLYYLRQYFIVFNRWTFDIYLEGWLRPDGRRKITFQIPKEKLAEWTKEKTDESGV